MSHLTHMLYGKSSLAKERSWMDLQMNVRVDLRNLPSPVLSRIRHGIEHGWVAGLSSEGVRLALLACAANPVTPLSLGVLGTVHASYFTDATDADFRKELKNRLLMLSEEKYQVPGWRTWRVMPLYNCDYYYYMNLVNLKREITQYGNKSNDIKTEYAKYPHREDALTSLCKDMAAQQPDRAKVLDWLDNDGVFLFTVTK
jgi:hypothetical protein